METRAAAARDMDDGEAFAAAAVLNQGNGEAESAREGKSGHTHTPFRTGREA